MELNINQVEPQADLVAQAAAVISAGGVAVLPTDTVYGLAADLFNGEALGRIFGLKARPAGKGLIAMLAEVGQWPVVSVPPNRAARALIDRFWPGPLTVVAPALASVPAPAVVDGSIGLRLPDNQFVRALIRAVGGPLGTTSANISGRPSSGDAQAIRTDLEGKVDVFIDGGLCRGGVESTVVDVRTSPPAVIREGAISVEEIFETLRDAGT